MRPKIEPQSRARTWILAPAPAHCRPKTVDVRLVMRNLAENACLQDCLGGKNLAFPAPIMEDGKYPLVLPSDLREAPRFSEGHGERFIDDNILPCAQCGGRERKMALIRAGDHDQIADRISRFPEVRSVYLMSASYDLLLFVDGRTLREVAAFVSERLSPLEGVLSTSTHFMLKTYKRFGVLMHQPSSDERLTVTP